MNTTYNTVEQHLVVVLIHYHNPFTIAEPAVPTQLMNNGANFFTYSSALYKVMFVVDISGSTVPCTFFLVFQVFGSYYKPSLIPDSWFWVHELFTPLQ